MPLSASRPIILDAETSRDVAALATLYRKFVHWARWTYHRDHYYAPADPRWAMGGSVDFAVGDGSLGSFVVPAPTTPGSPSIIFHVRASLVGSSDTIDLILTSSNGQQKKHSITYAGQGNALVGWTSFEWSVTPGSIVSAVILCTNQLNQIISLCGWWKPIATGNGITIETSTLAFPYRSWPAQDRPLSVHVVRRLARLANRYAAARPRGVVAKSYLHVNESNVTGSPVTRVAGIYKAHVGDRVSLLSVGIGHSQATSVTATVNVYIDGVLAGSGNLVGGVQTDALITNTKTYFQVGITAGAARTVEVRVDVVIPATTGVVRLDSISVEEQPITTGNLGLSSGDSVPGAFPTISDAHARSGGGIYAADWAAILDAIIWLWAKRYRVLVSDHREFQTTNSGNDHYYWRILQADEAITVRALGAVRSINASNPNAGTPLEPYSFPIYKLRLQGLTSGADGRLVGRDFPGSGGNGAWTAEERELAAAGRAVIWFKAANAARMLGGAVECYIPE